VEYRKLVPYHHCIPKNKETPARLPLSVGGNRFPSNNFKLFLLSVQSAFHLSLTVLVRYRSPTAYLALGGVYHPYSGCTLKQPDSATASLYRSKSASHPTVGRSLREFHPLCVCLSRQIGTFETALDLGRVVRPQFLTA